MTPKAKTITKTIAYSLLIFFGLYLAIPLRLVKERDRTTSFSPDAVLKSEIVKETVNFSAEEILNYSIKKTAHRLSFSFDHNPKLTEGKANCVGYAQMCAGIANYAFKVNGHKATATPVVGYVKCFGINLCDVLRYCMPSQRWENFVKDHDFVEYHIDKQIIYADASIYDLLLKDCKTTDSL